MSNIGYREIMDFGALSLKQLNDNLRALWSKVMGDIAYRDLAKETREAIESRLTSDDLIKYATIEQTAELVALEAGEIGRSVARLEVMAGEIAAQVERVDGDVSEVRQTATELSSTVLSLSGAVSQVQQTASGLSSTVAGLGGRVSALEQTDSSVAVKLKDPSVNANFEARIGSGTMRSGATGYGLSFYYGNTYSGSLLTNSEGAITFYCPRFLHLHGGEGAYLDGGYYLSLSAGITSIYLDRESHTVNINGDLLPTFGNTYDLGAPSGGRWRYIYTNNSVNTSDRRHKRDIAPLNAAGLLNRLKPVRYRLADDPEDGKIKFGFIAQDVADALHGTDYEHAELFHDVDPEHLHLCYQELIAVLVEGWQAQQARIDALETRLSALEARG